MSDLLAIAYISTARQTMPPEEIATLVKVSQANNEATDITGVLLYCHGSFMHYFEGPRDAAIDLYQRLKADERHYGLIELFRGTIEKREFKDWSMGYAEPMASTMRELGLADWRPPRDGDRSPGHVLLGNFWCNNCKT